MLWLKLIHFEISNIIRMNLQNKIRRRSVLIIFLLIFVAMTVGVIFVGINKPEIGWLSGLQAGVSLMITITIVAFGIILRSSTQLFESKSLSNIALLAPLPDQQQIFSLIAALSVFGLAPFIIFVWPFIIILLIKNPTVGIYWIIWSTVLIFWAILAAISTVNLLVQRIGRDEGLKIIISTSSIIAFLPLMAFSEMIRVKLPVEILNGVTLLGILVIPIALPKVLATYRGLIVQNKSVQTSHSVNWQIFPWWKIILRQTAPWVAVGMIIMIAFLVFTQTKTDIIWRLLGVFLLNPVLTLTNSALNWEKQSSWRLQLAPHASKAKVSLFWQVVVPTWLACAALTTILAIVYSKPIWLLTIFGFLLPELAAIQISNSKFGKWIFGFLVTGVMIFAPWIN